LENGIHGVKRQTEMPFLLLQSTICDNTCCNFVVPVTHYVHSRSHAVVYRGARIILSLKSQMPRHLGNSA